MPDPLMFARLLLLFLFVASPQPAGAQVAVAESGDAGWILVCALLVLLAALPGLALPLFVQPQFGGVGFDTGISPSGAMLAQGIGVVVVGLWAVVRSAIVAFLLSAGMPGGGTAEAEGLDAAHRQQGWDFR